jgi:hypothetical protein
MSVEGATDTQTFEAYVQHFLAPTLEKGQGGSLLNQERCSFEVSPDSAFSGRAL